MTEPTRTIKVENVIDPVQLKQDVTYSTADLTNAMIEQPGLFIEYSRLAAKASRTVDDLELILEVREASAARRLRDDADSKKIKFTDAALKLAIATDADVIAVKKAINEAKQIEANAKAAVEAFKQRRDMLIQLGADGREERKGELRTLGGLDALKQRALDRIQGKED